MSLGLPSGPTLSLLGCPDMITRTVLTCREEETTFHIGTRKDKILFTAKWVDSKEPVFSNETVMKCTVAHEEARRSESGHGSGVHWPARILSLSMEMPYRTLGK